MRSHSWTGMVSLLFIVGCLGCSNSQPSLHLTRGFAASGTSYGQVLDRFSRSAELYDGLDTVAKGYATWRSPALRRAAAEKSIERYHLPPKRAEQLRSEEEEKARGVREFHLALYTPKKDWNDLESQQSLWRAYLELPNGEQLESLQVEYLPKTDKSGVEYPYVTPWTREYRLVFPLLEGDEVHDQLSLVLAGPLGSLRFSF